jgi:hypothetical protein
MDPSPQAHLTRDSEASCKGLDKQEILMWTVVGVWGHCQARLRKGLLGVRLLLEVS